MGDLQAQLEEVKRAWEEERNARARAENELEVLRGMHGVVAGQGPPSGNSKGPGGTGVQPPSDQASGGDNSNKRRSEGEETGGEGDADRDNKRQRTE